LKFRSVRFKVTILYTSILGLILIAYSLLLYVNLNYIVFHEITVSLKKKAAEVEQIISLYSQAFEAEKEDFALPLKRALHLEELESTEFFQWPSVKKLDQRWRFTNQALEMARDYIVIYTPEGELVEKSRNIDPALLSTLEQSRRQSPILRTSIRNLATRDQELRVITRPVFQSGEIKYIIQLATPTAAHLLLLRSKLKLILITIPLFLLATSTLGVFFVNRVFKPVKAITQAAQRISSRDMSKRVQLEHSDEEIKSLVEAFNGMISRLEKSFRHIEDFSSNVAHELKTPLAIIRGELEVALRKERSSAEYQKAIQVALEELQRLLKTINDLLLLAKLDYRTEVLTFETVDLNEFLREITEQGKLMAAEKGVSVTMTAAKRPLTISANKLHLRRLFLNLLDNAIKFTPPGGRVNILVSRHSAQAEVAVRDTGKGISEEDLPKIFQRFFSCANTDQPSLATGLGLDLVQSIAKIHNGSVNVTSQLGQGSVFTVRLPIA
jgi:two-component system, OmpR family, heavy metal sensor histidine kinase CusS